MKFYACRDMLQPRILKRLIGNWHQHSNQIKILRRKRGEKIQIAKVYEVLSHIKKWDIYDRYAKNN